MWDDAIWSELKPVTNSGNLCQETDNDFFYTVHIHAGMVPNGSGLQVKFGLGNLYHPAHSPYTRFQRALDHNIWCSSITTATNIRLYSAFILTVLFCFYGAETWTLTKVVSKKIDSFDLWCQRHILRVHYSHHISNCEIRNRMDALQLLTSSIADDCNSSATLQSLNLKWITVVLYVPQFEDRLLTGNTLRAIKTDMDSNCWKRSETCQHWSAHRVAASTRSSWLEELRYSTTATLH